MINRKSSSNESPMPVMDDGWWESVLAEESDHSAVRPQESMAHGRNLHKELRPQDASKVQVNWEYAKDLFSRDQIINLNVTGSNRGGLLVEGEGLHGFVPFSHLVDIAPQSKPEDRDRSLESYLGRTLELKVIECVPEDGRVVFSERAAQAGAGKRAELFQSLHSGESVHGTVTNITDFGVFIDLGGVEGLIHISELSWGRVAHPNQIVKMGQNVEVQVLELSPERCRVALSLKRLSPNPWARIGNEVKVGQVVPATITSVLSYGAFARLDMGVEGLIHASEMPLNPGQSVKDIVSDGKQIQVRILHVDASHQRMGLSMKVDA